MIVRFRLVGPEHDAELAHDHVEGSVIEWKPKRVRRAPVDWSSHWQCRRTIQHWLVEVRGSNRRVIRECSSHRTRHNAGAGSDLQHALRKSQSRPSRDIARVRLKNQRDEPGVVQLRNGAAESPVGFARIHLNCSRREEQLSLLHRDC